MYKLSYYVPYEAKERTKEVLFNIGAGSYKNYDRCSFESEGMGQFRPLSGADPYIGKHNEIEYVKEYKVEMICKDALIKKAIKILKEAHPYEEVAYEVIKLEEF